MDDKRLPFLSHTGREAEKLLIGLKSAEKEEMLKVVKNKLKIVDMGIVGMDKLQQENAKGKGSMPKEYMLLYQPLSRLQFIGCMKRKFEQLRLKKNLPVTTKDNVNPFRAAANTTEKKLKELAERKPLLPRKRQPPVGAYRPKYDQIDKSSHVHRFPKSQRRELFDSLNHSQLDSLDANVSICSRRSQHEELQEKFNETHLDDTGERIKKIPLKMIPYHISSMMSNAPALKCNKSRLADEDTQDDLKTDQKAIHCEKYKRLFASARKKHRRDVKSFDIGKISKPSSIFELTSPLTAGVDHSPNYAPFDRVITHNFAHRLQTKIKKQEAATDDFFKNYHNNDEDKLFNPVKVYTFPKAAQKHLNKPECYQQHLPYHDTSQSPRSIIKPSSSQHPIALSMMFHNNWKITE